MNEVQHGWKRLFDEYFDDPELEECEQCIRRHDEDGTLLYPQCDLICIGGPKDPDRALTCHVVRSTRSLT